MRRRRRVEPLAVLRYGIRLARRVERAAAQKDLRKPIRIVSCGFLVRNRRLAVAIERLDKRCAYEGRMLLRSMVEIVINYAWIRLRQEHSRATRFLGYQPLELLRVLPGMRNIFNQEEFKQTKRNLELQRGRVRHFFRFRDKKGKMQWARSWAKVSSVEARLREVKSAETPGQPDPFLYGLYAWISSAVHGGPNSLQEVLRKKGSSLVAKGQPESNPTAQFSGAAAALAYTIEAAVEDLGLNRLMASQVNNYSRTVQGLRGRKKKSRVTRAA